MAIPVSEILNNVTTILNDIGMVHWTKEELIRFGTEGQIELAKLKPDSATKTVTHPLAAGARQIGPDDSISIIDVRQNENGQAVTKIDRSIMDRFSPGWMSGPVADYVAHWMDDPHPNTFYVYPAQSTSPARVVITHTFQPAPLVDGGVIGVLDIYQAQLENYILFRAFSKDSDAASAERAMAYGKAFYA